MTRNTVVVYAHYGNFTSEPTPSVTYGKAVLIYQNHETDVYLSRSKSAQRVDYNRLAYASQVIVETRGLTWRGMRDVNKRPPRKKTAEKHIRKSREHMKDMFGA